MIDLAVPRDNEPEARHVPGITLHAVDSIQAVVGEDASDEVPADLETSQDQGENAPRIQAPSQVGVGGSRAGRGVSGGANPVAPQGTEQTKWQFRNDLSRTLSGFGGLSHTLKGGVNWIHEPHLFISIGQGTSGIFFMGANDIEGPVQMVLVIGGNTAYNVPMDQYSLYAQDDWRVTDRLTLNLGVRYDWSRTSIRSYPVLDAQGNETRVPYTLSEEANDIALTWNP